MQPCVQVVKRYVLYTNTHPFNGPFSGLPGWADTRKVNPIWILLKQETVSGNGISWAICKSAPRSRQTTTPVPHHSVFTGRIPFLPPNQQRQSTEGIMYCIQRTRKLWTRNEFLRQLLNSIKEDSLRGNSTSVWDIRLWSLATFAACIHEVWEF